MRKLQVEVIKHNLQKIDEVLVTPLPITKWQKYVDAENNSFSFEFPGFMNKFIDGTSRSRYSITGVDGIKTVINGDINYISWYIWNTEKFSSGDYEHRIEIQVTGPIINTANTPIKDWMESKNWQSEGEVEEAAGISRISEVKLDNSKAIVSIFKEIGSKYPNDWTIYFKNSMGIYYISIRIQGTEKEMEIYQPVYDKIISSFKFKN
ncbi:hypothetical protein KBD45_08380 [Candidatus Dojkabacteria bacterium]|nr:hypothetical protein [Candidatus Dojkabacteria bacterium]